MPIHRSHVGIIIQTILWLLITLVFYTILRIEFLIWNWTSWFKSLPVKDIFGALLSGIRFDLSSLTWLSCFVLLGALIPWPFIAFRLKQLSLKTVFLLIHIPFLILNALDTEFIHFVGRRMTPDSFYLLHETNGKLSALWETYWPLILINSLLVALFYLAIQKTVFHLDPQGFWGRAEKKRAIKIIFSIGMLLLFVVMARGGFQPKPLEMAHATALSPDIRLMNLSLNSSFTIIHSLQKKQLRRVNYYGSYDEMAPFLNANSPGQSVMPWNRTPRNVVLFILESFGLEYTGLDELKKQSFTPFIDSLKPKSLYFTKSYANGRRSIEALPSLLAGIPSLLDEPFINSVFQTNKIPLLGSDLTAKGVWTGFFHGGANGTMFFQEFTERLGFAHYFGKNEYPDLKDDDGTWGIWDGPFLNFFGNQLDKISSPFFTVLFSLSSHHPFKVPEAYKNKLPTGPLPIHQSIAYTDLMLREFFTTYSASPWFNDTLFIFTADHTSKSYLPEYQTPIGSFRVPILLYFPGADFSDDKSKVDLDAPVQHIDIHATLIELFELPTPSTQLSRSLLKTGPRKVTLYLDGQQILMEKNKELFLSTETESPQENSDSLQSWKASRQYYINGLIDNNL